MSRKKRKAKLCTAQPNRNRPKNINFNQTNYDDYDDTPYYAPEVYQEKVIAKTVEPIRYLTKAQAEYAKGIDYSTITIGVGPAGTGKSHIALTYAADKLRDKEIERILVFRPIVEAGRPLGALPGTAEEKTIKYFTPMLDILEKRLGTGPLKFFIEKKKIILEATNYIRGSTFENCIVIIDECQNYTKDELKLLVTRIGDNCKMIFDGDDSQIDISEYSSGLKDILRIFLTYGHRDQVVFTPDEVSVIRFTEDDIVRNEMIKKILKAYRINKEDD